MEKNKTTSLLLCIFLGYFGAHKFYEGKIGMGFLYLFTMGLFFFGWIVDIIIIATKPNPYIVEKKQKTVISKEDYRKICPRCNSTRFHAYIEEKTYAGKTKSQTSLNLNPLKPLTVFNTKEKVIRPDITVKKTKFLCDDCGMIFK